MWLVKPRRPSAEVFVSRHTAIALYPDGSTRESKYEQLEHIGEAMDATLSGSRCSRIWLSGDLCRVLVADPILGVRDRSEAQLALSRRLTDESIGPVTVRIGRAPTNDGRWVCGVVQSQALAALRKHCSRIQPWWSLPSVTSPPSHCAGSRQSTATAYFDGSALLVVDMSKGKVSSIDQIVGIDAAGAERLLLRRLSAEQSTGLRRCRLLPRTLGTSLPKTWARRVRWDEPLAT